MFTRFLKKFWGWPKTFLQTWQIENFLVAKLLRLVFSLSKILFDEIDNLKSFLLIYCVVTLVTKMTTIF